MLDEQMEKLSLSSSSSASPSNLDKKDVRKTLECFLHDANADKQVVARAYASLAHLLLPSGNGKAPDRRDQYTRMIAEILLEWVSDTQLIDCAKAFAALQVTLTIDASVFTNLLPHNELESAIVEAADLVTGDLKICDQQELDVALREMLLFVAAAAGHKQTRDLAEQIVALNGNWLARQSILQDPLHRAAASVTLLKLSSGAQTADIASESIKYFGAILELATGAFNLEHDLAYEGLALATLTSKGRAALAADKALLSKICTLGCSAPGPAQYNIATALRHLTTYRQPTGSQDSLQNGIRKYAAQSLNGKSNHGAAREDSGDEDSVVDDRCALLLQRKSMSLLHVLAKSSSLEIRNLASHILLSLVAQRSRRGVIIQEGGAKVLLQIIGRNPKLTSADAQLTPTDLIAVQALCKLLVTTNPLHILGPSPNSPLMIGAVTPLSSVLRCHTASSLQEFECLMALTNLSSFSAELQDRISRCPGLLDHCDDILISNSHHQTQQYGQTMCRCAAMELLCNLVCCDYAFKRYTTATNEDKLSGPTASRLQIILALCDVDDPKTRLAALGTMATLTEASAVCKYITASEKRLKIIIDACGVREEAGVQQRGIVCLYNIGRECTETRAAVTAVLTALRTEAVDTDVKEAARGALDNLA